VIVAQSELADSLSRAWPSFVLVAALLALGLVAERGGVFRWAGAGLERLPGPPAVLGLASLGLVAVVTATMNLDTAVVFVTPVVVHAVRRRGLDPRPVAYGALVMANASSLLLPGANLTNLIVRGDDPIGGGRWLAEIAPAGLAVAVVSAAVLLARDRGTWTWGRRDREAAPSGDAGAPEGPRPVAVAAILVAGLLIVLLPEPALPVLAVADVVDLADAARGRLRSADAIAAVGPAVLLALFALVVALGWLARVWDGPSGLVADQGPLATAWIGAVGSVLVNNLPAAALLTAGDLAHPEALLVGLNLGPNLLVTGSLAAWLWWRTCRDAEVPVTLRGLSTRAPLTAVPAIVVAALLVAR
jgi:arsenical pump membrane protein